MCKIEIVFDDNVSTTQTVETEKEFVNIMRCFYKRKHCNFGNVMFVDFSKVKLVRVVEGQR